ncbi:hypothetical protein CH363_06010 [Leptospira haakeii]|uniref:Glycosyltransferase RgtA/B/C/D-like domain-containing protein n=2 Tax=Leptospira haakeii TaxID=2023198 RepID=A0ABX4PPZ6_9LEPT|nr:hypothetical protein CH363_06010 [Leptospira haakeii]PKA20005.1 hypothetical protein CH377_09290 [Leptospira haakeii]
MNNNFLKEFKLNRFKEIFLKVAPFIIIVWSTYFAYLNKFLQDDAFITFRYSENFINGLGIVFNPGEYLEGYTNFLWMLLVSLGISLGIPPEKFSIQLGLFFYLGTLLVWFRIAKSLFKSNEFYIIGFLFLLGFNYSFSSYATGGLETSLITFLISIVSYITLKIYDQSKYSALSLILMSIALALLVLTRMDAGLVAVATGLFLLYKVRNQKGELIRFLALISIPFALIVGAWLLWKLSYYGNILPNTFNAKVGGKNADTFIAGLEYFQIFLSIYSLGPFLILGILFAFYKSNFKFYSFLGYIGLLVGLISLYILWVGGDFMEFRFIIPILPPIVLALFLIYREQAKAGLLIGSMLIVTSISSYYFRLQDRFFPEPISNFSTVETTRMLERHLKSPYENWSLIGKKFQEYFGNSQVKIALTPAGVIPYYSKLYTLDMLGLMDSNVRNPDKFLAAEYMKSGHKRFSKINYLKEQQVNLIIGHPVINLTDDFEGQFPVEAAVISSRIPRLKINKEVVLRNFFPYISAEEIASVQSVNLLWIPLNESIKVLTIYLSSSEFVDQKIKENNWELIRL